MMTKKSGANFTKKTTFKQTSPTTVKFIPLDTFRATIATVWTNVKEFENVFGAKFDEAEMKKFIGNLFWDSPQFVRVTINGKEYTDENSHNCYGRFGDYEHNYDKERFIAWLLEVTKDDGF